MSHLIRFMSSNKFAVVGASQDRAKFGNKILQWYIDHKLEVAPINPKAPQIENIPTYPSLAALPNPSEYSVSVVTPPKVTAEVLREAQQLGIKNLWLQPGSEDMTSVNEIRSLDPSLNIIAGAGECVLVLGSDAQQKAHL
ncbi:CoA-binding protein [Polychytrium aggregatum]|uniref:CoA-binding protein n=1 Tax=Polychytrium aggregatum TaxID=110093 RepID=UPI0022FF44F4|nr:CoA-binding protein [Polychytrium aggregatum]KAI9202635.1 CoA-binding protein [Polychytrium aggregatum]